MLSTAISCLLSLFAPSAIASLGDLGQTEVPRHPHAETREAAGRALEELLADSRPGFDGLARASVRIAASLPPGRTASLVQRTVVAARWRELFASEEAHAALRDGLAELASDLRFQPLHEAPVPEGFPAPTPIHEVELKRYPAYRMATTTSIGAFGRLFRHIQTNDIPMTAPVEMTFEQDSERPKEVAMAFLYESVEQGATGPGRGVDVVDVPARNVVSIGMRGRLRNDRIASAAAILEAWVQARPDLEPDGSLRVFGYNSPMVPAARKLSEVQLPVRRVAGLTSSTSPSGAE